MALTNRRPFASVLRDSTFYIAIVGYLCELGLLYLSFSQVPEEYLHASHETATIQINIAILPPFAVLLFGIFYAGQHNTVQLLIGRYANWMIAPTLCIIVISIGAGHAFGGIIAWALLCQWTVLLIGTAHVWIIHRRLT